MAIIQCPECGHNVSDHAKVCPSCGIDIAGNIKTCDHCGAMAAGYNDVCPQCGKAFDEVTEEVIESAEDVVAESEVETIEAIVESEVEEPEIVLTEPIEQESEEVAEESEIVSMSIEQKSEEVAEEPEIVLTESIGQESKEVAVPDEPTESVVSYGEVEEAFVEETPEVAEETPETVAEPAPVAVEETPEVVEEHVTVVAEEPVVVVEDAAPEVAEAPTAPLIEEKNNRQATGETIKVQEFQPVVIRRRPPQRTAGGPQREERMRKKSPKLFLLSFIISLIVVGIGLSFYLATQSDEEQKAYDIAINSNDAKVLTNFLTNYKDAPTEHQEAIRKNLLQLQTTDAEWDSVCARHTAEDYRDYIARYPDSKYVALANSRIDTLDWLHAEAENSLEAYNAYIKNHPNGRFISEATVISETLDPTFVSDEDRGVVKNILSKYFTAIQNNDAEGLRAYLDPAMTRFNETETACQDAAVAYMHGLRADTTSIVVKYSVQENMVVEKKLTSENNIMWNIVLNVDEAIEHPDATKSVLTTYEYSIVLSPAMKIKEIVAVKK